MGQKVGHGSLSQQRVRKAGRLWHKLPAFGHRQALPTCIIGRCAAYVPLTWSAGCSSLPPCCRLASDSMTCRHWTPFDQDALGLTGPLAPTQPRGQPFSSTCRSPCHAWQLVHEAKPKQPQ